MTYYNFTHESKRNYGSQNGKYSKNFQFNDGISKNRKVKRDQKNRNSKSIRRENNPKSSKIETLRSFLRFNGGNCKVTVKQKLFNEGFESCLAPKQTIL